MSEAPDVSARLDELEARVTELTMMQSLLLRLMSASRPLARLLEHFGANETQEQAFYRLLDSISQRTTGPERDRVSFAYFRKSVGDIMPDRRNDREFMQLLIDTLQVERSAYRDLHAYMIANRWPLWE